MRLFFSVLFFLVLCVYREPSFAQTTGNYTGIYSGIPWLDDHGNTVSAHGANIIKDNGRFYLFGEAHTDTSNAFVGFNCYSSTDLYNWKFESKALPLQKSGRLGPNRVGERPKVLKCPATGEYIMLMHTDTISYKDPCVGYAISKNITGPYVFQGPILFKGQPIKKWDMGSFQDTDGTAYLLVHSGNIYKLSKDYKSIIEHVVKDFESEGESPSMFKKDGTYFWLASHRTSWERNDNFYYSAKSIYGPWLARGNFTPKGSLTWNSQTSFVLPIVGTKDTTFMYMGDRWAFPRQASAATYVWQPITVSDSLISIPMFHQGWLVYPKTGTYTTPDFKTGFKEIKELKYSKGWKEGVDLDGKTEKVSDEKGASVSVNFNGSQIGVYTYADHLSGYASITIFDKNKKVVLNSMVDMYANSPVTSLKFLSPEMKKGEYTLTLTVAGDHGNWSDKKGTKFGSKGDFVKLSDILFK